MSNAHEANGHEPIDLMYGEGRDFDAGRLNLTAEKGGMDALSTYNLHALGVGLGDRVLDVGSGPAAGLGDAVEATGATYTAYDKNPVWVESQAAHGHDAIQGKAHKMCLLRDNSMTVVHLRHLNGWLGTELDQTWHEIFRVGTAELRGSSLDFDWDVVAGPPVFMALVNVLKPTLRTMGFEHDFGARAESNLRRIFTHNVGPGNFTTETSRVALRAKDSEQLMEFINEPTVSVIKALQAPVDKEDPAVTQAKLARAAEIQELLEAAQAAGLNPEDVTLPDVVSVRFWLHTHGPAPTTPTRKETFSLPGTELEGVILAPGWDETEDPIGVKAVAKFGRIYRGAGHIVKGISPETYENSVDPKVLRARQDLAAVLNQRGVIVASARHLRPTAEGIISTLTGKKLIDNYGPEIVPADFRGQRVGEIMATIGSNTDATTAAILMCIYAARKAGVQKVLYGAVLDKVEPHLINDMFGDIMRPLYADGKKATVRVSGPGYPPQGIELATGYSDTKTFFNSMIDLQRTRNTQSAGKIIAFCEQLEESAQGLAA